jgi:hypothetical protein
MSAFITAAEAAKILGISQVALFHHRKRGTGPTWTDQRIPGAKNARPIYCRSSVEAYAARREKGNQPPGLSDRCRIIELEARVAALEEARPQVRSVHVHVEGHQL